ncbi:hypothetical protein MBLNU230_g3652t1 [Neophaeotheca triangularis]
MASPAKAKATASNQSNAAMDSFQRFWRKTPYAGDYLGLAILLIVYTIIQIIDIEPFHRLFRLDDPRIQFPHAENERVPVYFLFLYTAILPLILLTLWTLIFRPPYHKAHVTLLNFCTTLLLTTLLTDIFKNAIGRPRPDLLARCQPDPTTPRDELVDWQVCTETRHHLLHDGWRSFPSGHSSVAFAGLGYVALFSASQLGAMRPRAGLVMALVCLVPLVGAALIAISRLEDYRHDVFDVIAGSSLGFTVAIANWSRWWPSLFALGSEEPWSVTGEGGRMGSGRVSPSGGFQRVRDEEEGAFLGRDEDGEEVFGGSGSSRRL